MTATGQDIEMREREDKTIDPSPLTDENDNIVDLSSAELSWVVFDGDQTYIEKSTSSGGVSITDAANGEWRISLDSSDTDGMGGSISYHEARLVDSSGRESVVVEGEITVQKSRTT